MHIIRYSGKSSVSLRLHSDKRAVLEMSNVHEYIGPYVRDEFKGLCAWIYHRLLLAPNLFGKGGNQR